jgi:hypothetical protein
MDISARTSLQRTPKFSPKLVISIHFDHHNLDTSQLRTAVVIPKGVLNVPRQRFWMPCTIQSRHNLVWPCIIFHQIIIFKYDVYSMKRLYVLDGPEMRISCLYSSNWKLSILIHNFSSSLVGPRKSVFTETQYSIAETGLNSGSISKCNNRTPNALNIVHKTSLKSLQKHC